MQKEFTLALDELDIIIEELKSIIDNKDYIIILQGDLASGKTTLVKNYVKSLGFDDLVTSPTFSLQSVYSDFVYHYDVYNKELEEFISLGLLEEFEKEGLHFVEWGDERLKKLVSSYGFDTLTVEINKLENKRRYTINA